MSWGIVCLLLNILFVRLSASTIKKVRLLSLPIYEDGALRKTHNKPTTFIDNTAEVVCRMFHTNKKYNFKFIE